MDKSREFDNELSPMQREQEQPHHEKAGAAAAPPSLPPNFHVLPKLKLTRPPAAPLVITSAPGSSVSDAGSEDGGSGSGSHGDGSARAGGMSAAASDGAGAASPALAMARDALFSPRPAAASHVSATATAPLPRLYLSHEHPAVVAALAQASAVAAQGRGDSRRGRNVSFARRAFDYVAVPLALPFLALYAGAALLLGLMAALSVWPSLLLARRLYWACPFIPKIWAGPMRQRFGWLGATLGRLHFEGAHCVTVVSRLATLPLRRRLPDFYIAGFPKCGTTSLAAHLKQHPGCSGISGMPGHEALSKESHFFGGVLGRDAAGSAGWGPALYRSMMPTALAGWWAEAVRGAGPWRVFDATPTYACLPHVPARVKALTPAAKAVFMVREPTAAVWSAECMLRGFGVGLPWSLAGAAAADGGDGGDCEAAANASHLLAADPEHDALWAALAALPPGAPLPDAVPEVFYTRAQSYARGAQYADRLAAWAAALSPENLLVVDFARFVADPEAVTREVLAFVGADPSLLQFKPLPPAMKTDYQGRRMDPGVRAAFAAHWFGESNAALARMLGCEEEDDPLGWRAAVSAK